MQTEVLHTFPQPLLRNTSNNSKTAFHTKLEYIHYYLTINELNLKNMQVHLGATELPIGTHAQYAPLKHILL